MEGKIFVKNLSLFGFHGKDAISKREKREFLFDIEVTVVDVAKAAKTNKLSDTFDYKEIVTIASKIVDDSSCVLIETLAVKIAEEILLNKKVKKIQLTLSKRELLHNAISGITITLPLPDAGSK